MVLTHYKELADTKGLVLVRGDIVNEKVRSFVKSNLRTH
jgi:hypothetical protein